jgi:hypothetical protein
MPQLQLETKGFVAKSQRATAKKSAGARCIKTF